MEYPFAIQIVPEWVEEPLPDRCEYCIKFLYVHGIITDAERDAARTRLHKRLKQPTPAQAVTPRGRGGEDELQTQKNRRNIPEIVG